MVVTLPLEDGRERYTAYVAGRPHGRVRSSTFPTMTPTAHFELELIARLREVRANGPATEAELRLLRERAGGWALALKGQIEASERRLDAAVADPTTSLTEVAAELRRLELLNPELAELESLLADLDARSRELRAGWLRHRPG